MPAPTPFSIAVRTVAQALGLKPNTVRAAVAKGCPIAEDGKHDLTVVRAWFLANAGQRDHGAEAVNPRPSRAARTYDAATDAAPAPPRPVSETGQDALTRLRTANADLQELRVRKMSDRLVDIDRVHEAMARRFAVVARCMLSIPENLADVLTVEQRAKVRSEVDRALAALSAPPSAVIEEAKADEDDES